MKITILATGTRGDVQPFVALGVGPKSISRSKISAETLAQRIDATASDLAMQARARQVGRQIQTEDGIGTAIEVVRQILGNNYASSS